MKQTDRQLIDAATDDFKRRGDQVITTEATLTTWFEIIAMVQLALRAPGARENPAAQRTEKFIRALIEHIDPQHGDLWRLLSYGFDPDHDQ